jgi:hypothetical protein
VLNPSLYVDPVYIYFLGIMVVGKGITKDTRHRPFENLSRFLRIGNTQKITHKRLIEREQKLDEYLLKEKMRGKKDGDGK